MRTFFNIIWWVPYCGFLLSLFNAIAGLLWCMTIIGVPIGMGLLQLAKFQLAPHTHVMVSKSDINEASGDEMNKIWKYFSWLAIALYFPFGILNCVFLCLYIGLNFVTLLGIPNGIALAKTLSTEFNPVHKVCVPLAVGEEIKRIKGQNQVDKYLNKGNSEIKVTVAVEG